MPARRDFTAAELLARLERERELARLRVARWRLRRRVTATAHKGEAVTVTPSHPLPVGETLIRGGARAVGAILAPFEARGYRHDPRFWALVAKHYPELDLELEALKLAEWLTEPRNARRKCSKAFLDNWLRKAECDRRARLGAPVSVVPFPTAFATNGQYHQPQSLQKNPNPEADLPEWDDETARRSTNGKAKAAEMLPPNLRGKWRR